MLEFQTTQIDTVLLFLGGVTGLLEDDGICIFFEQDVNVEAESEESNKEVCSFLFLKSFHGHFT